MTAGSVVAVSLVVLFSATSCPMCYIYTMCTGFLQSIQVLISALDCSGWIKISS